MSCFVQPKEYISTFEEVEPSQDCYLYLKSAESPQPCSSLFTLIWSAYSWSLLWQHQCSFMSLLSWKISSLHKLNQLSNTEPPRVFLISLIKNIWDSLLCKECEFAERKNLRFCGNKPAPSGLDYIKMTSGPEHRRCLNTSLSSEILVWCCSCAGPTSVISLRWGEINSDSDVVTTLMFPLSAGWFQPVSSASSQRAARPGSTRSTLHFPVNPSAKEAQIVNIYCTSSPRTPPLSCLPKPLFHLFPTTPRVSREIQFCATANHHNSVWYTPSFLFFNHIHPPCLLSSKKNENLMTEFITLCLKHLEILMTRQKTNSRTSKCGPVQHSVVLAPLTPITEQPSGLLRMAQARPAVTI